MAIFARLVCMIVAVAVCSAVAGLSVATSGWGQGKEQAAIVAAGIGAAAGIFVGKIMGDSVVGKPPQS